MATSTDAGAFARLDRGKFFDGVRPLLGTLAQSQVDGVNRLPATAPLPPLASPTSPARTSWGGKVASWLMRP